MKPLIFISVVILGLCSGWTSGDDKDNEIVRLKAEVQRLHGEQSKSKNAIKRLTKERDEARSRLKEIERDVEDEKGGNRRPDGKLAIIDLVNNRCDWAGTVLAREDGPSGTFLRLRDQVAGVDFTIQGWLKGGGEAGAISHGSKVVLTGLPSKIEFSDAWKSYGGTDLFKPSVTVELKGTELSSEKKD